jgi:hypothetical protein
MSKTCLIFLAAIFSFTGCEASAQYCCLVKPARTATFFARDNAGLCRLPPNALIGLEHRPPPPRPNGRNVRVNGYAVCRRSLSWLGELWLARQQRHPLFR